jgi:hypothetical protein
MYKLHPRMEAILFVIRFGIPEPQLEIRLPRGTAHHAIQAELDQLAAALKQATVPAERWIVRTECFHDARGRVYLELFEASPAETARAMALLRTMLD